MRKTFRTGAAFAALAIPLAVIAVPTEIVLTDPTAVTILSSADASERVYRLQKGVLVVGHSKALVNASVEVSEGAVLRFRVPVELVAASTISGAGRVEVGRAADVKCYAAQPTFTGQWVLDGGRMGAGDFDKSSVLGWYNFDDGSPYTDSSLRKINLAKGYDVNGACDPQVVDDPERGKVLKLDGKSWLTGSGENGVQNGFDIGSSPFTLAMWVKVKPSAELNAAYKNGTLFMTGKTLATQRLVWRYNNGRTSLLYSNWGQDLQFYPPVPDDGAWTHYAVTHDGHGRVRHYVNNKLVSDKIGANGAVPNIAAGRLSIGYSIDYSSSGDNKNPFEGYLDDIVFAKSVLPIADLMDMKAAYMGDGVLPGPLAHVTNLGGGSVSTGASLPLAADARLETSGETAEGLGSSCIVSWEFEDADGSNSGTNSYTLSPIGTVNYVYDAERGGIVASTVGADSSYLSTSPNLTPADFPTNGVPFTVAFWLKTSACAKESIFWYGKSDYAKPGYCLSMRLNDSNSSISFSYGYNFTLSLGKNLSDWTHIAITYENKNFVLYVDGVSKKAWEFEDILMPTTSGEGKYFHVGRYHYNPTYGDMNFDNFRVYNRALSAAEVLVDRNAKSVRNAAAAGILADHPAVTLPAGKTLTLDGTSETVSGLAGDGSVVLAHDASLAVDGRMSYTGSVGGVGTFDLPNGLKWVVPDDGKDRPAAGTWTFFSAAESVLSYDDVSSWTFSPALGRSQRAEWTFPQSEGCVTPTVKIVNPGVLLIFR